MASNPTIMVDGKTFTLDEAAAEIKRLQDYTRESDDRMIERITRQRGHIDHMGKQIAVLRGALHVINEWQEPHPGFGFDQGSNGQRDYFRKVAARALGPS